MLYNTLNVCWLIKLINGKPKTKLLLTMRFFFLSILSLPPPTTTIHPLARDSSETVKHLVKNLSVFCLSLVFKLFRLINFILSQFPHQMLQIYNLQTPPNLGCYFHSPYDVCVLLPSNYGMFAQQSEHIYGWFKPVYSRIRRIQFST